MPSRLLPAIAACLALALASSSAAAESVIKLPGAHPDYRFEAEPHFMFGLEPPGGAAGRGFGPGFRGTVVLVQDGFIRRINDSVGFGFGADWVAFSSRQTSVWVPLVMQWNFWLTRHISVFGEPGFGFYLGNATGLRGAAYGGARFAFTDHITLTLRVGYPTFSAGLSFLI